jgi:hypothetical protein
VIWKPNQSFKKSDREGDFSREKIALSLLYGIQPRESDPFLGFAPIIEL